MKRPYQIAGAVIVVFSIAVIVESLSLSYFVELGPGPGYFPFWISVFVGTLGGVMIYGATFRTVDPLPSDFVPPRAGALRVLAVSVGLLWTILLMEPLGYRLTFLVFFLLLVPILGYRNVPAVVLVALGGSFGTYYLFDTVLTLALPTGPFGI